MKTTIPVVLITGASRGLGRGIAVEAAKRGYSVAVNFARDRKSALQTVSQCTANRLSKEQQFLAVQADISESSQVKKLVKKVLSEMGRIDALVNNAGVAPKERKDLTEMTEESFDEVLRVNLQGPFFLTQRVANYWLKETPSPLLPGGFKVVFVSSISADAVSLNRGEYCISKAGLAMVNKLWALRLADHGVQVYELRPGVMLTDMTSGVKEKYDKLLAEGLVPLKRWGTAEDVGQAAGALLSGQFPFSTGEVIYVDGGLHIQRL
ncbi:MAG: 3-ketoacyl-ACP reductase [Ignavibacteriales bacterium]|nr:3-ketoacyl-ACP reductase [Ignavibacteriales bacterium]